MAQRLLKKHGLERAGWRVVLDKRFRKLEGKCGGLGRDGKWRKVISLSFNHVQENTAYRVRNLILHEIAHALTPRDWTRGGHGRSFRRCAKRIGVRGDFHVW